MADSLEGAGFWLPSEFFDDFQVDKENLNKNKLTESDPEFRFPTEFPYDFGTKTDELDEKRWLMSTSPQSTLSQISSWNGRSAAVSANGSPTTPKNDAVGDLIYLAAGEVARLKLHGGDMAAPAKTFVIPNIYLQQQMVKQHKQGCEMVQKMYEMRMVQNAWSGQKNPTRIHGSGGGATLRRGCAGTGVFLPRQYNNNNNNNDCNVYSSDSRKKPGYSTPSIPNRNVHAINKNFDNTNGFTQSEPLHHPKLGRGFISEYDLLMARRNALLLQHHQSAILEGLSPMDRGVCLLPQEWTY